MNTSELKLKIFRQIDTLERTKLEDLYGVLVNFINEKKELNDWISLSDDQKQGIFEAIEEIDAGKGIPHNQVISKYKKKYTHA